MTNPCKVHFFLFPDEDSGQLDVACTMQSNVNVSTPVPLKICQPWMQMHTNFFIRSNVYHVVIVALTICCQPTSLFLTTSQADGVATIPPLVSNGLESMFGRACGNIRNLRDLPPKTCPGRLDQVCSHAALSPTLTSLHTPQNDTQVKWDMSERRQNQEDCMPGWRTAYAGGNHHLTVGL